MISSTPKRRALARSGLLALAVVSLVLLSPPTIARAWSAVDPQATGTTVYLVRHAEKDAVPENDPGLSRAGEQRALDLLHVLEEAGVTAIFASQYRRTQDTVRPLAENLGLEIEIVQAREIEQLVEAVRRDHQGGTIVISGHSDTVPEIVAAFGAGTVAPIEESNEYDNLYVVRWVGDLAAEVTTLKYGRRSQ